jgi:Ca2+-binding RTX toxin-like protein
MGGFTRFNDTQIAATEKALMLWSDLANITFNRVNTDITGKYAEAEQADFILGNFTTGPAVSYSGGWGSWRYYYNPFPTVERHMGVWIDGSEADLRAPVVGQRSFFLYVHEIGHALTLSHPGDYNVAPGTTITYSKHAEYIEDTYQYTVMSYFDEKANSKAGADYGGLRPMTPMLHDIAAIQKMYGANMTTRDTDTVYGFNASGIDADIVGIYGMTKSTDKRVYSIWDGGGEDTLDFSKYTTTSIIDLNEGGFSSVGGLKKNISIAFGAVIENGIGGSGADTIIGNDGNNELYGNAGNDTLIGNGGDDLLDGGIGTDTASYKDATAGVTVSLALQPAEQGTGGDGKDTLISIENLTGSAHDDMLTGDGLANRIEGGEGDDLIEGGLDNDVLIGGTHSGIGDILSYLGAGGPITVSLAITTAQDTKGAGKDTISQFENVLGSVFADRITGDKNANELNGADGDDVLDGGAGNDTLFGEGGDDTLIGGLGEDVLHGGGQTVAGDTASYFGLSVAVNASLLTNKGQYLNGLVTETDTFIDIENLTGGAGADTLTGNGDDNRLEGAAGNDTLEGGGGNDILIGGAGADIINGGADTDTASYETSAVGVTVVLNGVTLGIGGDAAGDKLGVDIENLTGSSKDDKLTGNGDANTLYGGGGNDTLDGGDDDDELLGGEGNDTLLGGFGADKMDGGNGIDTANYTAATNHIYVDLNAGKGYNNESKDDTFFSIENVTGGHFGNLLVGTDGSNILTGGNGDDTLIGNPNFVATNDKLFGLGGDDTMYGFVGDTLDGGTGIDTLIASSLVFGTVTVNLTTNTFSNGKTTSKIAGFENVMGDIAQNVIVGNALVNRLLGEDSADVIEGGAGADTLDGGNDFDTVAYTTSNAAVTIDLTKQGTNAGNNDAPEQSGGHAQGDKLYRFENVTGSMFNDIITGDGGDNVIEGGLGNDILEGGANTAPGDTVSFASATGAITFDLSKQSDTVAVNTGAGLDKISGFENAYGGKGADLLTGDGQKNTIDGREGNDTIQGGAEADRLFGGLGIDTLSYSLSVNGVQIQLDQQGTFDMFGNALDGTKQTGGDAADDLIWGFENVIGTSVNDMLFGDGVVNVLSGGKGGDTIMGRGGNDTLDGGEDFDTVDYTYLAANQHITVTLGTFTPATGASAATKTSGVAGDIDSIKNFEGVFGGAGNDKLTGNAGGNNLFGFGGDDTLIGLGGIDILVGGDGNDWIEGGEGADQIDGGAHSDTASYKTSTLGVTIHLLNDIASGGHAEGDSLDNIENLIGSAKNDELTGDDKDNVIEGGLGDDSLDGGTNHAGGDTISFASATGAITFSLALQGTAQVTGGAGKDTASNFENILGGAGADKLTGDSSANIIDGGAGNDIIDGGDNNDTLIGGAGNDTLNGGDGDDKLFGGDGNDTLSGGGENDHLYGGLGADTLTGGNGADTFHIKWGEGADKITDFASGTDFIEFDFGFAPPGTFVSAGGTGIPAHTGPGAAIIYDEDDGRIYYDSGPGAPVLLATLAGAPVFLQTDYVVLM